MPGLLDHLETTLASIVQIHHLLPSARFFYFPFRTMQQNTVLSAALDRLNCLQSHALGSAAKRTTYRATTL